MRIRNRQKTAWTKSHQREEAILSILWYLVNTSRNAEERRGESLNRKAGDRKSAGYGKYHADNDDTSSKEEAQKRILSSLVFCTLISHFNSLHISKNPRFRASSGPFLDYWRFRPMTSFPVTSDWPSFSGLSPSIFYFCFSQPYSDHSDYPYCPERLF